MKRRKKKPPARRPWTAAERAQLGKVPDAQLAEQLGRTLASVKRKREKLGKRGATRIRWTPGNLAKLGTMPDAQLAAKLKCSPSAVIRKRLSLSIAPADPARAPKRYRRRHKKLKAAQ
jgi:hypothetical protein